MRARLRLPLVGLFYRLPVFILHSLSSESTPYPVLSNYQDRPGDTQAWKIPPRCGHGVELRMRGSVQKQPG